MVNKGIRAKCSYKNKILIKNNGKWAKDLEVKFWTNNANLLNSQAEGNYKYPILY